MPSATAPTATRLVGSCQICEHDQKLREEVDLRKYRTNAPIPVMVHHGYKRPGYGSIVGDCPGVGHVPYEMSCELTKSYAERVAEAKAGYEEYLRRLQAGDVTTLTVKAGTYREPRIDTITPGHELWRRTLEAEINKTSNEIYGLKKELERLHRMIVRWQPRPVRTLEEELQKTNVLRERQSSERLARAAARDAKESAKRAKKEDLAARRVAIMTDLVQRFRALAAEEDSPARKKEAEKLARKTTSNSWLRAPWEITKLGIDDELVELGVAKREARQDGRVDVIYGWQFRR